MFDEYNCECICPSECSAPHSHRVEGTCDCECPSDAPANNCDAPNHTPNFDTCGCDCNLTCSGLKENVGCECVCAADSPVGQGCSGDKTPNFDTCLCDGCEVNPTCVSPWTQVGCACECTDLQCTDLQIADYVNCQCNDKTPVELQLATHGCGNWCVAAQIDTNYPSSDCDTPYPFLTKVVNDERCLNRNGSVYNLIRRPMCTAGEADYKWLFYNTGDTADGTYFIQGKLHKTVCDQYSWLAFNENSAYCNAPCVKATDATCAQWT